MTMYRPLNHLNVIGSLKDRQDLGWPRKMLTRKNWYVMTSLAVCLMHWEPEFVLKRRWIVLSERAPKTDILIFKRHREKH